MGFNLACVTIFGIFFSLAKGQSCTWPTELQLSGTWTDNSKGNITFTTNTLTGWVIKITAASPAQYISNWQCFSTNLYTSDSIIIARTQSSFVALNKTFYGYICLKLKKITTVSYRYYVNCPEDPKGANGERVWMKLSENETDLSGLCFTYTPALSEYRVMIKSGSYAAAKIDCPYVFLGSYDYIYTDSGGSVSCDTSTDSWSTCQTSTEMKFNYTTCPANVANSRQSCTWPTELQLSGTWTDNSKGNITFTTNTLTGWVIKITAASPAQYISNWQCFSTNLYTSDSIIIARTQSSFVALNKTFYGYICLKLKKITTVSYRYYVNCPEDPKGANGERVWMKLSENETDLSGLCFTYTPALSEYRVMIKSGSYAAAKIDCPYVFLGSYDYIYTDSGGSVSCDTSTDSWSTCQTSTEMKFNYTTCPANVANSISNAVWCVDTVPFGGNNYVTVYNGNDLTTNINNITVYLFSCFAISGGGTTATVAPSLCKNGQTPDTPAGGASLTMTRSTTCLTCPALTAPDRGSLSISTDGAVTTASYNCSSSYTLTGSSTRICQSNRTWSGTTPRCACPTPVTPANGTATVSSNGLTATFTCDKWFVLVGASSLTCNTSTNDWIGTEPTCDQCQALTTPTNGTYTVTSTGLTSVATYTCNVGTTLNGVTSRTCKTDKTWNATTPSCAACPGLSNISSGNVSVSTSGIVTSAVYVCATGYTLYGKNITTCQTTGTWDSQSPTCACNAPTSPANGSANVSADRTEVVYSCLVGFTLSGASLRTCKTDGTGWTNTNPVCVGCPGLSFPSNGNVSLATNGTLTIANYTCDVGFTMNGSMTSQCKTNGQWSTPKPSCSRCDNLPAVTSRNFSLETDGSTTYAQFTCAVGTTISGAVTVSCDGSGHWSTSSSNTTCVKCPDLAPVTGGLYSVSSNGTASTAQMSCASGYTLTGTPTIQCLSNGSWTLAQSMCALASASTASEDSKADSLLPAVIVLAILAVLLIAAVGGAAFYLRKIRKDITDNTKSKKHGSPGSMFPSSMAPVDHKQHMMDARHTSLSMTSSGNHHPAPTPSGMDSWTPRTPQTMRSLISPGNLQLDLVRETTSSVIFTSNNPAPWSKKPTKDSERFGMGKAKDGDHIVFPAISNGTTTTSHNDKPKKGNKRKKHSLGNKVQRQHSVTTSDDEAVHHNTAANNNTSASIQFSKHKVLVDKNANNANFERAHTEVMGSTKVPRLNLSARTERATTPVHHSIKVKDPDDSGVTPRSSAIATVQ